MILHSSLPKFCTWLKWRLYHVIRFWGLRSCASQARQRRIEYHPLFPVPPFRHRPAGHVFQPSAGRGDQQRQECGQEAGYNQRRGGGEHAGVKKRLFKFITRREDSYTLKKPSEICLTVDTCSIKSPSYEVILLLVWNNLTWVVVVMAVTRKDSKNHKILRILSQ